jgi:hypothetical protein
MDPEPASPVPKLKEIKTLQYKVLIHVTRVEEPVGPEEQWFAARPSDSRQSGLPEEDSGDGGSGGLRLARSLPWQRTWCAGQERWWYGWWSPRTAAGSETAGQSGATFLDATGHAEARPVGGSNEKGGRCSRGDKL